MFDVSPSSVQEMVSRGETDQVEFKTSLRAPESAARIMMSFANTNGGILLVGVDGNGNIVGLDEAIADRTVRQLLGIGRSSLGVQMDAGVVDVDGRLVAYAVVERAPDHLRPIMSSRGEVYTRVGSSTTALSPEMSAAFVAGQRLRNSPSGREMTAFVAMSFRNEVEPSLEDYFHAMQRAAVNTGYPIRITRMDLAEEDGDYQISDELMKRIKGSDIVICDFTLNSHNVYFELGYARGVNRRIIQTARRGTELEFDVRNWRTLFYRNATELEAQLTPSLKIAYADVLASPAN